MMKDKKTLYKIFEAAMFALIPTAIASIIDDYIQKISQSDTLTILANHHYILIIVAYLVSFVLVYVLLQFIQVVPFFRVYRQYEGKWVEFIRDKPEAPIAVCTLHFSKGEYHFDGTNFADEHDKIVRFKSVKFMGDGEDGFYYVTQGNQTYYIHGFGSIFSLSKGSEGFFEGSGFFFDVSDITETKVRHMDLFKFDKNFWKNNLKLKQTENPKKFSDREIFEYTKEYVNKIYSSN